MGKRLEDLQISVDVMVDGETHRATFVYDFDESFEEMTQRIGEYIRLRTWQFDNEPLNTDEARLFDALTEVVKLREQNDALMAYIDEAKKASSGERVSGEPLASFIARVTDELAELRNI